MLLAWYLAGMAARFVVLQLAAVVGAQSTLAALLIMPLAALCRLVGLVGMFFAVRAEFDDQLGRSDDLLTVLTRAILPFFLFYAAWHYLSDDVRQYAAQALDNIDWFATGEDGRGKVLDVPLSPLSIGFVAVAFGLRFAIGRLADRLPRWTRLVATYLEAVWVFGSVIILGQVLDLIKGWAETRRGLYWFFEAQRSVADAFAPLGRLGEAAGTVIGEGTSLLVLPLAWLTITGTVYNRALDAGEFDLQSRIRPELRARVKRLRHRFALPEAVRTRLADLADQLFGQWTPMIDALKIIWRAGVVPLGFFVLLWTVFTAGSGLLTWLITRLIGPQPLIGWWSVWLPVVESCVEAVLMPLQITLVAAAYAYSVVRVGERIEPQPGISGVASPEAAGSPTSAEPRRSSSPTARPDPAPRRAAES